MDISYYKKYEPFFGNWYIKREIGQGSYGTVFEVERQEMGRTYKAAIKAITIPKDDSEIHQTMRSEGMTESDASTYYREIAEYFYRECMLMARLKGNTNIVGYEDHQIFQHPDKIGWDIFIRMELLTPLRDYLQTVTVNEDLIKRLGKDICSALILCEKDKILHRDIKPENIFVNANGAFKLGDFGVARILESTTGASTKVGTADYSAPEVFRGQQKYDHRADIYSLGMVMYRLLNHNRMPFLPLPPATVTYTQKEEAKNRRMNGEWLPEPAQASKSMAKVILKACDFLPENRYISAKDFKEALTLDDTPVPAPTPKPVDVQSVQNQPTMQNQPMMQNQPIMQNQPMMQNQVKFNQPQMQAFPPQNNFVQEQYQQKAKQKKSGGWIIAALVAVVVIIGLGLFFYLRSSVSDTSDPEGAISTTAPDTSVDGEPSPYSFSVGDKVTLGYIGNGDMEWTVLDIVGDNALLIMCGHISGIAFQDDNSSVTWKECNARKFLNESFMDWSFEDCEKDIICTSVVTTEDNVTYGTDGGGDTEDKVFLLSKKEVETYFHDKESRILKSGTETTWWWLRSPGKSADRTAVVNGLGDIDEDGYYCDNKSGGLRPAMWVNAKDGESILTTSVPRSEKKDDKEKEKSREKTSFEDALSFDVRVGDRIKMGEYNGPIEWIILELDGDYGLVISEDILGGMPYSDSSTGSTWESSDVRKWLNDGFVTGHFSSDERNIICTCTLGTRDNETYGTSAGNETEDRVFLLSTYEVGEYFSSKEARRAYANLSDGSGKEYHQWLLRTPGKSSKYVCYVDEYGDIIEAGAGISEENYGVRPAMWINLKNGEGIIEFK